MLNQLAVWPLLAEHAASIDEVHVSHRGHFGSTRLAAADMNLSALGYVVPAHAINQALAAKLKTFSNVHLLKDTRLIDLQQTATHVQLTLDNKNTFEFSMVNWRRRHILHSA